MRLQNMAKTTRKIAHAKGRASSPQERVLAARKVLTAINRRTKHLNKNLNYLQTKYRNEIRKGLTKNID
jgi:vacuolar-type H+-ATPase subunit I/STV1